MWERIAQYFRTHPLFLLALAALNCVIQIYWFSRTCIHYLDFDGISYLGIARHIADGDFHSSINAFRSPLVSWLIALCSPSRINPLLIGKLLTIISCLGCAALLYFLTRSLWHSSLAASLTVLWFTLGRGTLAYSVLLVSADFLLTFLVLVYFIVLLRCLRHQRQRDWLILGGVHAAAFLAKAFALPWLALITLIAVLLAWKTRKQAAQSLALAALFPFVVFVLWASVLHSKYGVFTAGSQLKTNLLQWTLKEKLDVNQQGYVFLHDTSRTVDPYLVGDPMPPGSRFWGQHFSLNRLLPALIHTEIHNLPAAINEFGILLTPGGVLAFLFGLAALVRKRKEYRVEFQFAVVVVVGSVTLVLAYCMLVFDNRYAFPAIPPLIAVSMGFFLPVPENILASSFPKLCRTACIVLVIAGLIFTTFYWASPFRTLNRDFQSSCYDAGEKLKAHRVTTIVNVGSGPYPEHGIGWEAGYKAAYFGNAAIVAHSDLLPDAAHMNDALSDITKAAPEAVLLWGDPRQDNYQALVHRLVQGATVLEFEKVQDSVKGESGSIVYLRPAGK